MQVRVNDLPLGGKSFSFNVEINSLNDRLSLAREVAPDNQRLSPSFVFAEPPTVTVHVELEGITVFVKGETSGNYKTQCARCGEEVTKNTKTEINMVLKPLSEERKGEQVEDINFGYYDGQMVDCGEISEEFLILSLPFIELCQEDCKGLCSECGGNLNTEKCLCSQKPKTDSPFAVLAKLKLQ
ncbi:MAG: DUF177 domain-containing protein [Deltaproteobacteria bacterium]|nr:DUF177 domain-containing protein [Deltaproteobacteria bacterium]